MRDFCFLRIKGHPFLISLITPHSPQRCGLGILGLQWQGEPGDPAPLGMGTSRSSIFWDRWGQMARVSFWSSESSCCLSAPPGGRDTFINNKNRTDTEITRMEGGDGTEAESAWRLIFLEEILALSDCGSCNPGSFCWRSGTHSGSCFQWLRDIPPQRAEALGTKISFLIHLQSLPAAQYIRRGNAEHHKPASSASLYVYQFFQWSNPRVWVNQF